VPRLVLENGEDAGNAVDDKRWNQRTAAESSKSHDGLELIEGGSAIVFGSQAVLMSLSFSSTIADEGASIVMKTSKDYDYRGGMTHRGVENDQGPGTRMVKG
jgi:hypothetical protein